MARGVLVLIEHCEGKIDSAASQLLAIGQRLAEKLKVELVAAVIGYRHDGVVRALQSAALDRIVAVDDPRLARASGEVQAQALGEVARQIKPRLILMGYTLAGMELAPAIAARLGANAFTNCVGIDAVDGAVKVTRPVFDNTLHVEIALEGDETAVVALQKGAAPELKPSAKEAPVERLALDLENFSAQSRLVGVTEEPRGEVDLTKAAIIVAVGRGIGGAEKIRLVSELAEALGGVLACSRPVVDVGWLPRERQVGASGKTVAPKVYIACGISGAIQHLSGMRESKRIIAINKDPNAPIFQVAHFGVIGDLFEIVPALTKAAKESRPG
ncbi:MAG TPA: electron transfer flavoprotein subunit alpha/FixB family protein [Candidatus Acidoferrales bacterium]|nr:electron transfer flavoprotein subunit alpha/FixB family protein [Candidatus Acidoferrales bacterium]